MNKGLQCLSCLSLIILLSCANEPQKPSPTIKKPEWMVKAASLKKVLHLEIGSRAKVNYEGIFHSPMLLPVEAEDVKTFDSGDFNLDPFIVTRKNEDCLTIQVSTGQEEWNNLTTLCVEKTFGTDLIFTLTPESYTHVFGLGQQFVNPGKMNGDINGRIRKPGNHFGNRMVKFDSGNTGNTQVPIVYFTNQQGQAYALLFDNLYSQTWDFSKKDIWKVSSRGDAIRLFVLSGKDLKQLRAQYLSLTGRPPVPPKKAFGLWLSEFGYDNWEEIDSIISSLRQNKVPFEGFVMDLPWFGGVRAHSDRSQMGSLSWDENAFPNPTQKIQNLRQQGIGLILIEEPYVSKALPEHKTLSEKGYLVRQCAPPCRPTYLNTNPWWGRGGMIDWSHQEGAAFWHELKRNPLIEQGVMGHWTDLGEPEQYYGNGWYYGYPGPPLNQGDINRHSHAANHNLYNFFWSQSIFDQYQVTFENAPQTIRPFILSRSGTAGSQRFGVAMWSGDVSSRFTSLASQANAQMHMSLSGFDYYGSDVGGFYRGPMRSGNPVFTALYTRWLANAALTDVPLRPHTENLCNCNETTPEKAGHYQSNLATLHLRYRLIPYLYSLAHKAYRTGEAVFPPLIYHYPTDPNVSELGQTKMIGEYLILPVVADKDSTQTQVYLPKGKWYNFRSQALLQTKGEWSQPISLFDNTLFKLPLFARSGAIIPLMYVDEATLNSEGMRSDGTQRDELWLRIYPDSETSSFTYYEDDGYSLAYTKGSFRQTTISQVEENHQVKITIQPALGSYQGASTTRDIRIELPFANKPGQVLLNQKPLQQVDQAKADQGTTGWINTNSNLLQINLGSHSVSEQLQLLVNLAD